MGSAVGMVRDCSVRECHTCQRPGHTIGGTCGDCRRLSGGIVARGHYLRAVREVLALHGQSTSWDLGYSRNHVNRCELGVYVRPDNYQEIEDYYRRQAGDAWPQVDAAARAVVAARRALGFVVGVSA